MDDIHQVWNDELTIIKRNNEYFIEYCFESGEEVKSKTNLQV